MTSITVPDVCALPPKRIPEARTFPWGQVECIALATLIVAHYRSSDKSFAYNLWNLGVNHNHGVSNDYSWESDWDSDVNKKKIPATIPAVES
ncbi:uncharacterized protein N7479_005388 [Penicillium vulpinum]|uniref:uncharacterized protein n=1 Tax=Penicillium vulpinum TaxID=29845 RepID=UPI002547967C|nr:uncharacterized protein N7479_005388 [Penicillium vulpinum]KAJ5958238.1 hypothetical protein N7479_005388 [Penicillium vulpinum]